MKLKQNQVKNANRIINLKELSGKYRLILDIGEGELPTEESKRSKDKEPLFPCLELAKDKKNFIVVAEQFEHNITKFWDLKKDNIAFRILDAVRDEYPFDDELFDRIEMHYLASGYRKSFKAVKYVLNEADRVLKKGGLMTISGEYGYASMEQDFELVIDFLQKRGYDILTGKPHPDFPEDKRYLGDAKLIVSSYGKYYADRNVHAVIIARKSE